MPEIEIIKETPLTYGEAAEKLNEIKKEIEELAFRTNKANEYMEVFGKTETKKIKELREKLEGIGIQRLKERHIVKLIDLMPEDEDSIKAILSSENLTLKQEDIQKVLECMK